MKLTLHSLCLCWLVFKPSVVPGSKRFRPSVCLCCSEAQGLEMICISLGDGGTAWALDASGSLWFRTGICSSKPQGNDNHWWQVRSPAANILTRTFIPGPRVGFCVVFGLSSRWFWFHGPCRPLQISISDYVVFDQGSFFQTLLQATQSIATVTRAPMDRVVAFLSQYSQCQPSLVSANGSGVWVASGQNQVHLARGSLVGQWGPVLQSSWACFCLWLLTYGFIVGYQELSGRTSSPEGRCRPPGGPSSRLHLFATEKVTPGPNPRLGSLTQFSQRFLCFRYFPVAGSKQKGPVLRSRSGRRTPPLLRLSST